MDGIQIDSSATDGVLSGLTYGIDTLTSTINNQYLWTLATMFIGTVIVLGFIRYLMFRRPSGGSLASLSGGSSNGVTDAAYASKYLASGGDIKNASNQTFIRAWANDYEAAKKAGFSEDQSVRWAKI